MSAGHCYVIQRWVLRGWHFNGRLRVEGVMYVFSTDLGALKRSQRFRSRKQFPEFPPDDVADSLAGAKTMVSMSHVGGMGPAELGYRF